MQLQNVQFSPVEEVSKVTTIVENNEEIDFMKQINELKAKNHEMTKDKDNDNDKENKENKDKEEKEEE